MNSDVLRRSKISKPWIRRAACVWLLSTAVLSAACGVNTQEAQRSTTHLVMIVDGLRPDYVTTELMPRLTRLGQRGVFFQAHHAVFPTVTRVNSSSITTGAYPETHGLMSTIYIPESSRHLRSRILDAYR